MKNRKLYHAITSITIFGPILALIIYFFASSNAGVKAILEAPKLEFPSAPSNYNYLLDENDYWEIDDVNEKIIFKADIIIYKGIEIIDGSISVDIPEFFLIKTKAYAVDLKNKTLVNYDLAKPIQEGIIKVGFSLGLLSIIGIGSGLIAFYIISKKMKLFEQQRRLSVLMALWPLAFIFLALSIVTNAIAVTFIVIAISWTIYYIEWAIDRKKRGLSLNDGIAQKVKIIEGSE